MSVWAYEKNLPLTVENARKQTRFHPRCGTSFAITVLIMAIFIYTFLPPVEGFWGMLGSRIAILPLIAGISYESLKLTAKYQHNPFIKLLILPGLLTQKITTSVPDDSMLEVAINSLKKSLEAEEDMKKGEKVETTSFANDVEMKVL